MENTSQVSGGPHYELRIPVVYEQPEYVELRTRFPAYVDPTYKQRFSPIYECRNVRREKRTILCKYLYVGRDITIAEALADVLEIGRPALYEELLGLPRVYPEESRLYPILAIGSRVPFGKGRGYPRIMQSGAGPCLELQSDDEFIFPGSRLLVVVSEAA